MSEVAHEGQAQAGGSVCSQYRLRDREPEAVAA